MERITEANKEQSIQDFENCSAPPRKTASTILKGAGGKRRVLIGSDAVAVDYACC